MDVIVFYEAFHIEQRNTPKERIANAITYCEQNFILIYLNQLHAGMFLGKMKQQSSQAKGFIKHSIVNEAVNNIPES